ncbi:MAG: threonylcarbamoyl-AMP synthase [Gammaproteobacteria bacterium]|nr:threonylcarbamoyl-AMP synthase [Gammaproteobacteria bacterium]
MTQQLDIHPKTPQPRLIQQACTAIRQGGVIVYPTDSSYAIGCHLDDKVAAEAIRHIRHLDAKHHFTLMCRDLSELASYARVDDWVFRLLKKCTPDAYTFILSATKEVPRRLQQMKRKTIGLRVPDNAIVQALLTELNEPLMSVTLQLPDADLPIADVEDMPRWLNKQVDLIINGGHCGITPTTVVDLTGDIPHILRHGKGDTQLFE